MNLRPLETTLEPVVTLVSHGDDRPLTRSALWLAQGPQVSANGGGQARSARSGWHSPNWRLMARVGAARSRMAHVEPGGRNVASRRRDDDGSAERSPSGLGPAGRGVARIVFERWERRAASQHRRSGTAHSFEWSGVSWTAESCWRREARPTRRARVGGA